MKQQHANRGIAGPTAWLSLPLLHGHRSWKAGRLPEGMAP